MKKNLIAIVSLSLIMTMMPLSAFAAETAETDLSAQTEAVQTESTAAAESSAQTSAVKNAVVSVNGKLCYFDQNGNQAVFTGWKTIGKKKYWADSKGNIASRPTKIKKVKTVKRKKTYYAGKKKKYKYVTKKVTRTRLYMFKKDGTLVTKKGIYKLYGKEYYGLGKGVLKTGWAAKGNHAMYFSKKNGKMIKGKKVGYLKIPKNGRLGKAYALGVKTLDKNGWSLKSAYKFSYRLKYRDRWYRRKTSEAYAIRGFTKKNGNCFVMAATFYIQAKLLGYNVKQVKGKVAYIFPHSWTVIKQKGKWWVYDPNFRNETGRNGWKIWYGKRGTWKYTNYKKMN